MISYERSDYNRIGQVTEIVKIKSKIIHIIDFKCFMKFHGLSYNNIRHRMILI